MVHYYIFFAWNFVNPRYAHPLCGEYSYHSKLPTHQCDACTYFGLCTSLFAETTNQLICFLLFSMAWAAEFQFFRSPARLVSAVRWGAGSLSHPSQAPAARPAVAHACAEAFRDLAEPAASWRREQRKIRPTQQVLMLNLGVFFEGKMTKKPG